MVLFIFTASYPYSVGGEKNFLNAELPQLQKRFERIVLIPRHLTGEKENLPKGIEVDESYSAFLNKYNKVVLLFKVLLFPVLYKELITYPRLFTSPKSLYRLFTFLAGALLTRDWIKEWFVSNNQQSQQNLFYTYWFDQAAFGVGLLKNEFPIKLVSRAHGYDLYEEYYYDLPYWPCRALALSCLDRLFTASHAGLSYITNRYPAFSKQYEVSLLGATNSGFTSAFSTDGTFRILTCSLLVPVKRIDLMLAGIALAASQRPSQKFEWHHIGNGSRSNELQKRANDIFPSNANAYFLEYQDNESLMKFYHDHSIDVFMNASTTEGTPVSIMEAISCGIPVIATNVGGNPEIVSERNGILLNANPSPEEIACAILKIVDNPAVAQKMRLESRKVWEESYNAETNFQKFAERLEEITKG